jgi:site-specific DNA recombinase
MLLRLPPKVKIPADLLARLVALSEVNGPPAAMYARISRDRVGANLGVNRQLKDQIDIFERHGLRLVAVFADNDMSASKGHLGKPRPDYLALLTMIKSGNLKVVTAWHTDRLHRHPMELEAYIPACDPHSVPTYCVQAGQLDLATPSGRLVARQLGAVAKYEVEIASERQKAKKLQKAQAGEPLGGRRRFGWLADGLTKHPEEFPALADVGHRLLAGEKLAPLAESLNARGLLTTAGNPWTGTTLGDALRKPTNAGLSVHDGQVVGKALWDGAWEVPTWEAIRSLLDDPARYTQKTPGRVWIGTGVYLCGVHDDGVTTMTSGRRSADSAPTYRCRVQGHLVRVAAPIDDLVERFAVAFIQDSRNAPRIFPAAKVDLAGLHEESNVLRRQLDDLDDDLDERRITKERWSRRNQKLAARLESIRNEIVTASVSNDSELRELVGDPGLPAKWFGSLPDRSDGFSVERRATVVNAALKVTLLPPGLGRPKKGQEFDPRTVRIEPR